MIELLFYSIANLLGCAFGALLMKRFGLRTIKEKRVEVPVDRLVPHPDHLVARLTSLAQFRHRHEEHEDEFEKCADYQCRGSFLLILYLQSERVRLGGPIEEPKPEFNFDEQPPPPSITAILQAEDCGERRNAHAS